MSAERCAKWGLLTVLLAFIASAQPTISRGALLKKRAYQTYATATYFVDPTGADTNPCTAAGTLACLTLGGVYAKLPTRIRHDITVNVAAGSYAFSSRLEGIIWSTTATTGTAGVNFLIEGPALTNAVPATGTATGTTTTITSNANNVPLPIFTDAAQAWTVDNLRGRFVVMTSGLQSGQARAIVSNTATTLTTMAWATTPLVGSTYAIQTPAATFTGEQSFTGFGGAAGTVRVSRIDFTSASTTAHTLIFENNMASCAFSLPLSRSLKTFGSFSPISVSVSNSPSSATITGVTTAPFVALTVSPGIGTGINMANAFLLQGGFLAVSPNTALATYATVSTGTMSSQPNIVAVTTGATATAIRLISVSTDSTGVLQNSITAICPVGSTGAGINSISFGSTRNVGIVNCGTGIVLNGLGIVLAVSTSLACTNTTTCVSVTRGGRMDFLGITPVFTGVTNELQQDGTNYTFAFLAALAVPRVISNGFNSSILR